MKKFGLIILIGIVLAFTGCESVINIEAPTDLTVRAASNGLDLVFSWNATTTTDIDGYKLYYTDGSKDTILWEGNLTTCTVSNPPIGKFYVIAYKGSKSESDPSNEVNTAPVVYTDAGPIYYTGDPDTTHPSAYYWDSLGIGHTLSLAAENKTDADMYLDNEDCLASPSILGSSYHSTGFKDFTSTFDNLDVADSTGYINATTTVANGKVYMVYLSDTEQYVKIEITNYNSSEHSVIFKYALQKIKGYRRFK